MIWENDCKAPGNWIMARRLKDISFSSLMEVYLEGNSQNNRGLLQAEQDFWQYLQEVFFQTPGACYALWVWDGRYACALRLEPYKDGELLEGVETAPDLRRRGFAKALMRSALAGRPKVYSHVNKENLPSLALHKACGFRIISHSAQYIDGSADDRCYTLCREE